MEQKLTLDFPLLKIFVSFWVEKKQMPLLMQGFYLQTNDIVDVGLLSINNVIVDVGFISTNNVSADCTVLCKGSRVHQLPISGLVLCLKLQVHYVCVTFFSLKDKLDCFSFHFVLVLKPKVQHVPQLS